MWPFGIRSKLKRELDRLAFYNDKGIDYSRHNPVQVETERAKRIAAIDKLVAEIGRNALPESFVIALGSGELATDLTGKYLNQVKVHWRKGSAP